MNKQFSYDRYHRQLILKDFGEAAQQKLLNAKVLVIGAGGLGCPALQYLTAAGVGTVGIVDDDVVSLSNLHRQVLYSIHDIGSSKAQTATKRLKELNNEVDFHCYDVRLTSTNAADIIGSYDFILDGSDNFATRYLVNDTCVLLDKPLVYGGVGQYEGQVAIFNCRISPDINPVNYRDLFPVPPLQTEVLNCEEAGVLGVVPGIIGTMMANETIKVITGIGRAAISSLITYDSRTNRLYEIELTARTDSGSMIPPDLQALKTTNYDWFCSRNTEFEIDNALFSKLLDTKNVTVVDVRENAELPHISEFAHLNIPVSELMAGYEKLRADTLIFFCQSGKRSLQAAQQMNKVFGGKKKVYSLKGGIVQWLQEQKQTV